MTRDALDSRRWTAALVGTLAFVAGVATSGTKWLWPAMATIAVGTIALAWRADRDGLAALLRVDGRSLATGLAAGAIMVGTTYLVYPLAVAAYPDLAPRIAQLYRPLAASPGPLPALPILLLAVVAEELIWRGLVLDALSARLPAAPSVLAAAALYALPQIASGSAIVIAVALVCGIVWGAQRVRTGGLTVPLATHAIWSAMIFAVAPLSG